MNQVHEVTESMWIATFSSKQITLHHAHTRQGRLGWFLDCSGRNIAGVPARSIVESMPVHTCSKCSHKFGKVK